MFELFFCFVAQVFATKLKKKKRGKDNKKGQAASCNIEKNKNKNVCKRKRTKSDSSEKKQYSSNAFGPKRPSGKKRTTASQGGVNRTHGGVTPYPFRSIP